MGETFDSDSERMRSPRNIRGFWRRLALGIPTLLGLKALGFFIPYRHAALSPAPPHYPAIETLFREAESEFRDRLGEIEALGPALLAIAPDAPAPSPRWNQDWFPWLDAALAYAIARHLKPALWLEIGSGHSTRVVARAIADGKLPTRLAAIDPEPRARLAGLNVEWHRSIAQGADPALFRALRSGDVLFIDSSHILMPGTDVDYVLNQVLPLLPSGVHLHVHDIFLPDAYPHDWAWRGYNEQNAFAPLILSGAWALLGAGHFMATRMERAVTAGIMGRLPRASGPVSSLWLRKR